MPRAVVERGLADQVLSPDQIVSVLKKIASTRQSSPALMK
jgi:chemotaxis response regulator CheB